MRLESFRVRNYRSINDSGEIAVSRITALLGRNESGKSNLLRALHSLNPIEGFSALKPIKDFPRHRRLEECEDDTPVLSTTWVLDEDDKEALLEVLPRATDVERVTIGRSYQGKTRTAGTLRPLCQVAPPSRACRARTGRCAGEGAACNAAVDPPHSGRSPVRPRRRREEQVDLMLMSERIAVFEQSSRVSPSLSLHQAMCMVEHGRKQTAKIRLDALGASGQVFEPA